MSDTPNLLATIEQAIATLEVALPTRDQTAMQLQGILHRRDYEIREVLDIIASDQALTTEVLRVANSPFYSGLSEISTIQNAVVRIGAPEVVRLAFTAVEKDAYKVADQRLGLLMAPLWDHAMGVALGARWLARRLGYHSQEHEAFIAGLLHDVGKLLLIRVCSDLMGSGRIPAEIPDAVFSEILRESHCRQGAFLMEHWGLPETYARIVRHHHDEVVEESDSLLLLVRLADLACRSLGVGLSCDKSLNLVATEEAHHLDCSDILLAELGIMLEDAFQLS